MAAELNQQSEQSLQRNDPENALSLVQRALNLTDSYDPNISLYRRNIERAKAAKANKEGNSFMLQGNYEAAIQSFQQAIRILTPLSNVNNEINKTKDNIANGYNQIGHRYFNQRNFEKAGENYQRAINESSVSNPRINEYRNNVEKTKDATKNRNADNLNREGRILLTFYLIY
jgi:tetratricopeptide (TPR) repeat protein